MNIVIIIKELKFILQAYRTGTKLALIEHIKKHAILEVRLKDCFAILIADRNPYVRELMLRELRAEGYNVRIARNAKDIIHVASKQAPIDLLILDVGIPDIRQTSIIRWLKNQMPVMKLIVHSFTSDYELYADDLGPVIFIEKKDNSIERLKKIVSDILKQEDFVKSGISIIPENARLNPK